MSDRPKPEVAFMCSVCRSISHNPNDVSNHYCGRCHKFVVGSVLITGQAKNAMLNGSRVRKVNSQAGDGNENGTVGTILSSINGPPVLGSNVFYFVEWDSTPRIAVGVMGAKVEAAT